jgi:hypothetical protein
MHRRAPQDSWPPTLTCTFTSQAHHGIPATILVFDKLSQGFAGLMLTTC